MIFDSYQNGSAPDSIAYFSMEVGLEPSMPTYSGGLGVLAGDTLKAAADLSIPMVGVTLLHRKGYFRQQLDEQGNQTETSFEWNPSDYLELQKPIISIWMEGRKVYVRAWRYLIKGVSGHTVPVYFMDTCLDENSDSYKNLTDHLYGGDEQYRFCQEVLLGLGGVELLSVLGYNNIKVFHMNEGHSALLGLALLKETVGEENLANATESDIDTVRRKCVFTTHTPVPAGHDKFHFDLVARVLGEKQAAFLASTRANHDNALNLTSLALMFSWYINGVSHQHEKISQDMFPEYPINSITNGVHARTWTSAPFKRLFDLHMEEWSEDPLYLRYAISIPLKEIRKAHREAKKRLIAEVARKSGINLSPKVMTIGFARRATAYKRADLIFTELERLKKIAETSGPIQIVLAGKAHPYDEGGKQMIRRIFQAKEILKNDIPVVYLQGYDMESAKFLCSGVDLWLNTPLRPREASGTSGMKAALNGIPSLSVLDGWWIEGHVEGVTGWAIESGESPTENFCLEIESLYHKLEKIILPMYYNDPDAYTQIMRSAIALNASFFSAQRMMIQYLNNAYNSKHNNSALKTQNKSI
ncbi:MAG: alpha-glucan family phosphorylase [Candidatus Aminicenantes bacterium]|nr:alpha-glucan family phosphorylase [Candidatus Aminicenantes bacterium]